MTGEKVVIHMQKPSQSASNKKKTTGRLLAQLCFYYPQYTLQQARRLPYKHVIILLEEAKRMKAREYLELTQIAAAPHTKKGEGYKQLLKRYAQEAK